MRVLFSMFMLALFTIGFFVFIMTVPAFAQVVKIDDKTIEVTKKEQVKLEDAKKQIEQLNNQITALDKTIRDTLDQKDIVLSRITELEQQFQSVGIDPIQSADAVTP